MASKTQVLIEFKKQLSIFFDELIAQFPKEGDLIVIRLFLTNQIAIEDVMGIFINTLNKNDKEFKKMITERDEVFFLEHDIFDTISKQKSGHFKKLWSSGQLDKDDKQIMWKWLDTFVYLANKYENIQ
jgi:hypothetical protein